MADAIFSALNSIKAAMHVMNTASVAAVILLRLCFFRSMACTSNISKWEIGPVRGDNTGPVPTSQAEPWDQTDNSLDPRVRRTAERLCAMIPRVDVNVASYMQ
jgi:hypothetical protein